MKKIVWIAFTCLMFNKSFSQTPKTYSSADILQQLKKLEVFGSVLYIAAHPDDENTRLLGYLANERKFRTGYLSLTRGDGGQNLIGDEQGIDLGLIRTQELLAARRVDGAEQFFSRAYDFGFSKSPEEAMKIWGHDKILSDVVWVIRKFRPDVLITRFPTTGEGGHGHHTASAILAGEAFEMAADTTKFPEQLKNGITAWQPKRLLWNSFNFGNNNAQSDDRLKIDVGMYNPILGQSYGEIAAESRSQHKSQGFGVPAQRGESFEYFSTIKGGRPLKDLMDGVDLSSKRMKLNGEATAGYNQFVDNLIQQYNPSHPAKSINRLDSLYTMLQEALFINKGIEMGKLSVINELIASSAGLFMEAGVASQLNVLGDSVRFTVSFNNRLGLPVEMAQVSIYGTTQIFDKPAAGNINNVISGTIYIPKEMTATQPYWFEYPMQPGAFEVRKQEWIGMPENIPVTALFQVKINGHMYNFPRPVIYKSTDPVKGELYQQPQLVNPAFVNANPSLIIFANNKKNQKRSVDFTVQSNKDLNEKISFKTRFNGYSKVIYDSVTVFNKTDKKVFTLELNSDSFTVNSTSYLFGQLEAASFVEAQMFSLTKIAYDHIPNIYYNYLQRPRILKMDLNIAGTHIAYIAGAGDKVPQALIQMGYQVTMLNEKDITSANLKQFDAVVTGVRAYNTNLWLSNVQQALNKYVKEGGVFLVQYNTNNGAGPLRQKIGPYPFTLGRNRVTDETAAVNFLMPNDPSLNYPNKITQKDFEGWIQERSVYHAENIDSNYRRVLSMKDPGEKESDGSLIIADYGKGKFVYTGLVFFRELPAGVPGAYRLLANLLAAPVSKKATKKTK
ncbi:MAG: PIG-L family deacetylase [Rhizobacter sp.]|nr:PIG-L family deacetylase [Ferruginibacter sp.]